MSLPNPPFPEYPWTTAFDALVDVLKEDEVLKRGVKAWRAWDGEPADLQALTPAQMPWIQLTPVPSPIRFETVNDYKVNFLVRVAFATRGTNVRHLMNFWGAIMQALRFDRPFRETTVGLHLRNHGTTFHQVAEVGVDPKLIDGDFMSSATIVMLLYVPA